MGRIMQRKWMDGWMDDQWLMNQGKNGLRNECIAEYMDGETDYGLSNLWMMYELNS